MDKFYIITNTDKDKGGVLTKQIAAYIRRNGKTCIIQGEGEITNEVDCVLVLGGDGTLLRAARDVVHLEVPLLGINLGTLGYMAEIDQNSIYPAMDKLMVDQYSIERRMMLMGTVYHGGEEIYSDIALNDIVISREGPLRVVRFKNFVNEEFLNQYQADGIIISTATGSTGYSLSAGGPIVSPEASLMLMTPLAPHTINTRSIIFPDTDRITVEIGKGRTENPDVARVTFDGADTVPMETGDRIAIEKAKQDTRIVKINNISFLEVLRNKMSNN
ncbi:MAG: NAD(+)/NADH kinase [Lachnospiraceae bacterium]|nr:NAD(+)/NADH kinase [Lachnospiraceae bacterium]